MLETCLALGITPETICQRETATRLSLDEEVGCTAAQSITLAPLRGMIDERGDAISLRVSSDYGIREFSSQNSAIDEGQFTNFKKDLDAAAAGDTIRVRLTIDKDLFVRAQLAPRAPIVVYLFASNLRRALAGSFAEITEIFFAHGPQCCCLLLEEERFTLRGPYFAIWGAEICESAYREFGIASDRRLREAELIRQEQVSWLDFHTEITPYQFFIAERTDPANALCAVVAELQYLLALVYLADSVRWSGSQYVAAFSGPERTEISASRPALTVPQNTSGVLRLFIWAYSGRSADKLPILRSVISSTLSQDRNANYVLLSSGAQRVFEAARSNYAAFVSGFVTKYFDKLRDVDAYVRGIALEIANRVSDLVKNLTTNLLATVGVVVGGFIAYALDKKSSPRLLSLGLQVYGAYILLFPFVYSLIFQGLVDYLITRREFRRRTSEMELSLHIIGLGKRSQAAITARTRHFWFVLITSAIIYIAIGLSCFWGAHLIVPLP